VNSGFSGQVGQEARLRPAVLETDVVRSAVFMRVFEAAWNHPHDGRPVGRRLPVFIGDRFKSRALLSPGQEGSAARTAVTTAVNGLKLNGSSLQEMRLIEGRWDRNRTCNLRLWSTRRTVQDRLAQSQNVESSSTFTSVSSHTVPFRSIALLPILLPARSY
jgi:hypothetical protein